MLSHQAIETRLKSGSVNLRYYFLPGDDGSVQFHKDGILVHEKEPTSRAWTFFQSQLKSDRLSLTLGPIVKSHSHRLVTGRPMFRNQRGYADLRETGGTLVIGPRETISVATNERIALDGNTSALLLPRITLGDAGLLLNTAYIDPFWDGTLQLVLTNSTPHAQSIALLEPIAQCFFFDLEPEASSALASAFPGKSHHYGQNWYKILEEDAEPFPTRKRPLPINPGISGAFARVRDFWNEHQTIIRSVAALLLILAGVSSWNAISGPLGRLPDLERKVAMMEPYFSSTSTLSVPTLQNAVRDLQESAVITGTETITIPADTLTAVRDVAIDAKVTGSAVVVAGSRSNGLLTVSGQVTSASHGRGTIRLRVVARTASTTPSDHVVDWALIP